MSRKSSDCVYMNILITLPLAILLVPYLCIRMAGDYHLPAFLFGIVMACGYAWIIYAYGRLYGKSINRVETSGYGIIDACFDRKNRGGAVIAFIYSVRYIIRAGFIVYVVAYIMKLRGANFFVSAILFLLVSAYSARGDFKRRQRIANYLLWWMIVPIILLVVLSINRIDYSEIARTFLSLSLVGDSKAISSVFASSWVVMVVLSTIELMLFSYETTGVSNYVRSVVWCLTGAAFAYMYVLGMIGENWIKEGAAKALSFGVSYDYLFAAAWLIGACYVAGAYLFYSKEFVRYMKEDEMDMELLRSDEERAINRRKKLYDEIRSLLIIAATLLVAFLIDYNASRKYMLGYLVYADVVLSIILPGVAYVRKCN